MSLFDGAQLVLDDGVSFAQRRHSEARDFSQRRRSARSRRRKGERTLNCTGQEDAPVWLSWQPKSVGGGQRRPRNSSKHLPNTSTQAPGVMRQPVAVRVVEALWGWGCAFGARGGAR